MILTMNKISLVIVAVLFISSFCMKNYSVKWDLANDLNNE